MRKVGWILGDGFLVQDQVVAFPISIRNVNPVAASNDPIVIWAIEGGGHGGVGTRSKAQ
jgi:hypothetical protein